MSYSANQYNYATPLSSSNLLFGKTFTGAQMLDFDAWLDSIESAGVTRGTYTVDTLGKIISITATENDAYTPYLAYNAYIIPAKPSTKYTLSYRRSGAAGLAYLFEDGATSNMVVSSQSIGYGSIAITTSSAASFITFRLGAAVAGTTSVYSEIMLNEGDIAQPYEEYNNLQAYPNTANFFTLHDNTLDGSYYPVSGDVGLWGNVLSDASGNLSTPFVVSNTEWLTVNAFRMIAPTDNYPVAFTVKFYSNSTLVYTITESNNDKAEYVYYLPSMVFVSGIVVSVTKISKANAAARLYNLYNLPYVKRLDTLSVSDADFTLLNGVHKVKSVDALKMQEASKTAIINDIIGIESLEIQLSDKTAIRNTIDIARDVLSPSIAEDTTRINNTIDVTKDTLKVKNEIVPTLTNVHTRMKEPYRKVYGKVYITYTDIMLDSDVDIVASTEAYNSNKEQINTGFEESVLKFFTLYDNNLTGSYAVNSANDYVGWTSAELSDSNGIFSTPQVLELSMYARPVIDFSVLFDKDNIVSDFTVTFVDANDEHTVFTFTNNTETRVVLIDGTNNLADIEKIIFSITKTVKANRPATILNAPLSSTLLYRGYDDVSELMSIDLLEELTYEDAVEALGGISANEVTVVLDNSTKDFFFNSNSLISKQLRRNRRIVPWLGVEVLPGEIEWHVLGTFWSYKWDVPANGLTATVVGFDTIGLLDLTTYVNHQTQINRSIGQLIEYVLDDAKESIPIIEYVIDASLYDIVIPYAWFDHGSHAAALRKISMCYPMHIYCDRQGRIVAAPQKLRLDYYYDAWSDSTNVIDKRYSSLYTALPNIVNVTVTTPAVKYNEQLVQDNVAFTVNDGKQRNLAGDTERSLSFNAPYLSDIEVSVECDNTLAYTYDVYSWGITFYFTGSGTVRSITCNGTCVDTATKAVITKRDIDKIRLDGAVTRDVTSDFIQTTELANTIIDRLFSLSEYDKYDAEVTYRGDIALTINDPILLQNGIAPDNRYNIKRHELNWNGYLTGSADLNT